MITLHEKNWDPAKNRLLADGAWGTELVKRGLPPGDAPERLNDENPDLVSQVANAYLQAGSDIILTNTFVGSRLQLKRHNLQDKTTELNRAAAIIALGAAQSHAEKGLFSNRFYNRPLVAGSMGPTGKLLLTGEVNESELIEVYSEQAEALASGGVDCFLIETMVDLQEMVAAVQAAAGVANLPIIASMTYQKGPKGYATIMGNRPEQCANAALEHGAAVVGANCGTGIENYVELAGELCKMDLAPVWIKANAGMPKLVGYSTVYEQSPEAFASYVPELLNKGVAIVGGCCGTTPDFVSAMRQQFNSFLPQ